MLSAAAQFLGDDVSRVEKGAWALALQALSQLSRDTVLVPLHGLSQDNSSKGFGRSRGEA